MLYALAAAALVAGYALGRYRPPRRGWYAWQHRNDPPPPRGPAMAFNTNRKDDR